VFKFGRLAIEKKLETYDGGKLGTDFRIINSSLLQVVNAL
jgi:hypothetical protein